MKKMLSAAGFLLGLALAHTSCQAPAPPAPKSELIGFDQKSAVRKLETAKPTSQQVAQRKVVARPVTPGIIYGSTGLFIEKPHLCKVKYGRHRWVMV